jgi:hypothetical protein
MERQQGTGTREPPSIEQLNSSREPSREREQLNRKHIQPLSDHYQNPILRQSSPWRGDSGARSQTTHKPAQLFINRFIPKFPIDRSNLQYNAAQLFLH